MFSQDSSKRQRKPQLLMQKFILSGLLTYLALVILVLSMTGCEKVIQRVSITPAPEEAKGQMYIASEKPIKVKSIGVQFISSNDILGVVSQDNNVTYLDKKLNKEVTVEGKGKLLVQSKALDLKGYSEIISENGPIDVGIEGTDIIAPKNVEGYYLVHKDDLKVLMQKAKEHDAWVAKGLAPQK